MKKIIATLFILCCCFSVHAQIQVGSRIVPTANAAGKIKSKDLAAFKKTTTYFTLQYRDYEQKEQYQKAIAAVWKITPFKIIKPEDLEQYIKAGNASFFTFGGYTITRGPAGGARGMTATSSRYCYDLWLPNIKKSGRVKEKFLSRTLLFLEPARYSWLKFGVPNFNGRRGSNRAFKAFYQDAKFYNWGPGFLKGYLAVINNHLEGKTKRLERGIYTQTESDQLAQLQHDTLYIPKYLFYQRKLFTSPLKTQLTPELRATLHRQYPYPFRIVTKEKLNQLILSGRPVKYLIFVRTDGKLLDIFDGQSGKLLYSEYVKLSYNFKPKDLKHIGKRVRKAAR